MNANRIIIKKWLSVFGAAALMLTGCRLPADEYELISDDEGLEGVVVTEPDAASGLYKLFVLNEGQMGNANSASLDFLRFKDGKYVGDAFSQMNKTLALGLGDVANDLRIHLNTAWALLTNSGIVEIFNPVNERHIAAISIPMPRNIVFDYQGGNAYVTSYDGAVLNYNDPSQNVVKRGSVYRISLQTLAVTGKVEVGYQPEGIAVCNNKIFVANSGGYNAGNEIGYDDRVTVIEPLAFGLPEGADLSPYIKEIHVARNLKYMFTDGGKYVWVSAYGDYYSEHSGLYRIDAAKLEVVERSEALKDVKVAVAGHDSGRHILAIGADEELENYDVPRNYNLYKIHVGTGDVEKIPFSVNPDLSAISVPYGVAANPYSGEVYISDAVDYRSPGLVYSFSKDLKTTNWKTDAGIMPAHFSLYKVYY